MRPSTVPFVIAIVIASLVAGCGDSGSNDTSDGATTTAAPGAKETSFDSGLPRSVRYGDFTFAVSSVKRTSETPTGVTADSTVAAYAVLGISAQTDLQEYTWKIPTTGLLHLELGGDSIEPVSSTTFSIEGTKPVTGDVVFPVAANADLSKASLVVQEYANDPDERRIPARLALSGKTPAKRGRPVALQGSPTEYKMGTIGDSVFVKVVSADLAESVGTRENGAAWPASDAGLRQPREGHAFLRVHFVGSSVDDSPVGCGSPEGPGVYREDGVASDDGRAVGSDIEGTLWCEGEPPYDMYAVFEVPADKDSYDIFITGDHNDQPGGGDYTFSR